MTGPSTIKRLSAAGLDPHQAADRAGPAVAAAAMRHTAGAGRDALDVAITRDALAVGYQWVADEKPCAFCAMLAARGAVYRSQGSGTRTLRDGKPEPFHDDCSRTIEALYGPDAALPEASTRFAELWSESTEGLSGREARRAFRRAYNVTLPTGATK